MNPTRIVPLEKMLHLRVRLAALAGLAVALGSCTSDADEPEPEPELGSIPVIEEVSELVLPLEIYRYSSDDYRIVQHAAWLLIGECVSQFGAEYTAADPALVTGIPPFDSNARRYGLFDPEHAATLGYNFSAEQGDTGSQTEPDPATRWNPGETELLLVRGGTFNLVTPPADVEGRPLPEDGCQGEANRILREGTLAEPPSLDLFNDLNVESHERAEADSRVEAAIAQWSECMGQAGYNYRTIWEPNNESWPEPPGDQEITVAQSDVACKQETNLVGIFYTVETAYQERIIEDNAEALAALRGFMDAQKENAARVVAEG